MFVLDTNVVSGLRKVTFGRADPLVVTWASRVDAGELYVSAITILELEIGVLRIERRDPAQVATLRAWVDNQVLPEFDGRVLVVDTAVARRCPRLAWAGPPGRTRCADRGDSANSPHGRC